MATENTIPVGTGEQVESTVAQVAGLYADTLKDNLLPALEQLRRGVPRKPTLEILRGVRIVSEDCWLRLTVSDLDTTVTVLVGAKVGQDGEMVVADFRALYEAVKAAEKWWPIQLSQEGNSAVVRQVEGATVRLETAKAENYPPTPALMTEGRWETEFDTAQYREAVTVALPCAATEKDRWVLHGVHHLLEGQDCELAGADGVRLGVSRAALALAVAAPVSYIVPLGGMQAIQRMLLAAQKRGRVDPPLVVSGDAGHAVYRCGYVTIVTCLTRGNYPNYPQSIPAQDAWWTRATVDCEQLRGAVAGASGVLKGGSPILRLMALDGELGVSAHSLGRDYTVVLPAQVERKPAPTKTDTVTGLLRNQEHLGKIAFNVSHIAEWLAVCRARNCQEVGVEFTGPSSPGVWRMADTQAGGELWVIMPLFVQW